ncbi:MAG: helix-turn-helix transcriptional regulator [Bacteroidales bacterium]|nr:helix-turn-helix transcriptional regulator [Bacteroidales bacterium]
MRFTKRIRQLREEGQMPQRQLAAALEIDTATYSKIEKGERRVKAEQIVIIAEVLGADKEELLALWLADQIPASVANESAIVDTAMKIVKTKSIKK